MHHGIIWLMEAVPFWVQPILLWGVTSQVCIRGLRWAQERAPYDESFASWVGDFLLALVITSASYELQHGAAASQFLDKINHQIIIVALAVGLSAFFFGRGANPWGGKARKLGDIYHMIVVAPMFMVLVPIAVIIIVKKGDLLEVFIIGHLLAGWGLLLVSDLINGRLDQQVYRKKLGKS